MADKFKFGVEEKRRVVCPTCMLVFTLKVMLNDKDSRDHNCVRCGCLFHALTPTVKRLDQYG